MAPSSVQLQDDQKFALMKFRRSVSDILKPDHDDQFLLRWLRARNWDSEAAEKMIRNSMEWRKKWEVDTTLKTWEPSDVLKKYIPSGIIGLDKDKTPVIVVPFAGFDVWGLLHSVSKKELIRQVIVLLEYYLNIAKENGTHQLSVIFDMDNFVLKQYAWKPATELIISYIQMYEANYPEILKICYIINAPSIFSLAYNIVKKFMGEYTINKIQIYKADQKKWLPMILQTVPVEILPKYFGGEAVDPDGDIKCSSKVKQGGKVPKELYNKNQKDDTIEFTSDIVKSGKQLILDFISVEQGSILKWDFHTEDHDIKFGILCRNGEGEENWVVPIHKVNSHMVNELGILTCDYPATYSVTFDNSHSMMRSKKIFYDIQLTVPVEKLDLTNLPEDIDEEDTHL